MSHSPPTSITIDSENEDNTFKSQSYDQNESISDFTQSERHPSQGRSDFGYSHQRTMILAILLAFLIGPPSSIEHSLFSIVIHAPEGLPYRALRHLRYC